ncbi:hypothetical protein A3D14_01905 [Candidatus Saccharibacteria bacterium RIFCSPHIGHO2_02_FULL_47_12]|nr:MAG: hypothetical protein A3D14_01905 [Candidatus Saccharibacteria bacterium RIFCSPHIGHO2_02_FULL_47_12]
MRRTPYNVIEDTTSWLQKESDYVWSKYDHNDQADKFMNGLIGGDLGEFLATTGNRWVRYRLYQKIEQTEQRNALSLTMLLKELMNTTSYLGYLAHIGGMDDERSITESLQAAGNIGRSLEPKDLKIAKEDLGIECYWDTSMGQNLSFIVDNAVSMEGIESELTNKRLNSVCCSTFACVVTYIIDNQVEVLPSPTASDLGKQN